MLTGELSNLLIICCIIENVENIQVNNRAEIELLNYSHTLQCSMFDSKLLYQG